MIETLLTYGFMRNAVLAAILVSIACGIVGTLVVVRKMVFVSGGIAHAAFGGIGLGYFLGINPVLTAIPFSLLSAIAIGVMNKKGKLSEDSATGILWAVGMALGVLFVGLTPGYAPDLHGYLFGSILTVPLSDIFIMIVLDTIIVATVFFLYKEFQALSYDEEFSEITGVPTRVLYFLLLCLIGLSVILLMRVVGIVLVIALLTIPTAIVRQFCRKLNRLMAYSTLIAVILTMTGLWLSFLLDLPSGATVVLVLASAFLFSALIKRLTSRVVSRLHPTSQ
jgi:zinc transport system permease protein